MRLPRRLTMLCCTFVLAGSGGSGLALAQSAGDEQYQDPFGDEPAQTQTDQGEPAADPDTTLTQTPQSAPGAPAPAPAPQAPAPALGNAPRPARLADTGIDTRLFLSLGLALLLSGVGLRLRTLPERF